MSCPSAAWFGVRCASGPQIEELALRRAFDRARPETRRRDSTGPPVRRIRRTGAILRRRTLPPPNADDLGRCGCWSCDRRRGDASLGRQARNRPRTAGSRTRLMRIRGNAIRSCSPPQFLAPVNRQAAARGGRRLRTAPALLPRNKPRLGSRLVQFGPREVRRLCVDDYEIRYEIQDDMILIANLRHARENR